MNKIAWGRIVLAFAAIALSVGLSHGVSAEEVKQDTQVNYNYANMLSPFTGEDSILGILLKNPNMDMGAFASEISSKTTQDFTLVENEVPQTSGELKEGSKFYIPQIPLDAAVQQHIFDTCARKKIPVDFMFTLALHESGFRAGAVSSTNDYGLFQINICNHKAYAKKTGTANAPKDPYVNTIWSATMIESYWNQWLEKYPSSLKDVIDHTLSCYNMGPTKKIRTVYTNRWWQNYETIKGYFEANGYSHLLVCKDALK